MTYEEAYLNCKSRKEFRKMLEEDTAHAMLFNKDRLEFIEEAVNNACKVHPDWSDEE